MAITICNFDSENLPLQKVIVRFKLWGIRASGSGVNSGFGLRLVNSQFNDCFQLAALNASVLMDGNLEMMKKQ